MDTWYIRTEHMDVGYDGKPLIEHIEIGVRRGEILTAPEGAGGKRETGARPVRSRHCMRKSPSSAKRRGHWETGKAMGETPRARKPAVCRVREKSFFQITRD